MEFRNSFYEKLLIPIIFLFFVFDGYTQKMDRPIISINEYIQIEINNFRMVDVIEQIEIIDLNKRRTYIFKCDGNDYFLNKKNIYLQKKILKLKTLKKKRGKFHFNIKVISKTAKELYNKKFNPSSERLEKVIKINFI
jgi:hypothetical protein